MNDRRLFDDSISIALLELRCIRRAIRTWILALLALAAGGAAFVFYHHAALQHYSVGHFSGNIVPGRFLMAGYAACFLIPLLAGIVFLAFDHRHRDQTAGVVEVLDARPVGNLAFFLGRLMALVVAMWLVCAVFAASLQGAGLAADKWLRNGVLDGWLGPVEPWSLATFLFVDAPPALVLWGAIVLLLAAVVRNRLAVVVVGLALLAAYGWLLLHAPLRLLPAISVFSGFDGFASDMAPRFLTVDSAMLRSAQVLLGAGFVALGAAGYARADSASKAPTLFGGLALIVAGLGGVAVLGQSVVAAERERQAWRDAHVAQRNTPAADLLRLDAEVVIEPATALHLDASLTLRLAAESQLTLSLNPGLQVLNVALDGEDVPYRHENGLLHVAAPSPLAETEATLRVVASGLPDARFAYLDSVVDPLALGVAESHYRILGAEPMVFSGDYAVLLPALRWLPMPGPNLEGAPDFHDLDLRLDLPADWQAVAPGAREQEEPPSERKRLRFRTESATPLTGLVAGRFERYAATVGGVEMELLLHPGHRRNAEFFRQGQPDVPQLLNLFLGMRLDHARRSGLGYPHERFSVVEVPGRLRGFDGGWRLDTALALPGIALLREYGLPSMRMTMPPIHMVMFFMQNDFSGGDPTIALWRSVMRFRTAAAGEQATMLDFLMDNIAKSALHGYWPSFFSAHHYDAVGSEGAAVEALHRMMGHGTAVDHELKAAANRVAVSEEFLTNTLGALDFAHDAKRAVEMLNFKGRMVGRMLAVGWPGDGEVEVIQELLRRHGGGVYTLDDLHTAAEAAGAPLDSVVGEWWRSSDLPGFVASPLSAYRLEDGPDGPRYQLRLDVCNAEPVPGLVRLRCGGSEVTQSCSFESHAVQPNACVEIGEVTSFPPQKASLDTYLSRNGNGIVLPAPTIDAERTIDAEPLQGARESAWRPPQTAAIVVDDLAEGFSLDDEAAPRGLRLWRRQASWTRQETHGSWGQYARTATWSESGDGDRSATFAAQLPHAGRWRLDYHLPGAEVAELEGSVGMSIRWTRATHKLGRYEMALLESAEAETLGSPRRTPVEFDGSIAEEGWNHLGDFDLRSTNVALVVTDRTDGDVVVVDAIRWRPLDQSASSDGQHDG